MPQLTIQPIIQLMSVQITLVNLLLSPEKVLHRELKFVSLVARGTPLATETTYNFLLEDTSLNALTITLTGENSAIEFLKWDPIILYLMPFTPPVRLYKF